jgi:hypothetical protein
MVDAVRGVWQVRMRRRGPRRCPLDFIHDQLFDGRKIRVFTVVDIHAAIAGDRGSAELPRQRCCRAIRTGSREVGCPKTIRLGNGREFVSQQLDLWALMRCDARLQPAGQAH